MDVSLYRIHSALYHAHRIHRLSHFDGSRPLVYSDVVAAVPGFSYEPGAASMFDEEIRVVGRRRDDGFVLLHQPDAGPEHRAELRVAAASLLGEWLIDNDPIPTAPPTTREDGMLFAGALLSPSWAIEPVAARHRAEGAEVVVAAVARQFDVTPALARFALAVVAQHGPERWDDLERP